MIENKVLLPYELWAITQCIMDGDIYNPMSVDEFPLSTSPDNNFHHIFTFSEGMKRNIINAKQHLSDDIFRPAFASIFYFKKYDRLYIWSKF